MSSTSQTSSQIGGSARLASDEVLWSECLTGAAYFGDLTRIMRRAGFEDVRAVSRRPLSTTIEGIKFGVNLRGFKLPLEDACEDYGQVAVYRGTIPGRGVSFALDLGHVFVAGDAMRVCKMLRICSSVPDTRRI